MWLQLILAAAAVISAGSALFVALRAQKWRDTDDAKKLIARVTNTEGRLDVLEDKVPDLATKEDIAKLVGKIETVCQISERTEKSVDRIEDYFLHKGVGVGA